MKSLVAHVVSRLMALNPAERLKPEALSLSMAVAFGQADGLVLTAVRTRPLTIRLFDSDQLEETYIFDRNRPG